MEYYVITNENNEYIRHVYKDDFIVVRYYEDAMHYSSLEQAKQFLKYIDDNCDEYNVKYKVLKIIVEEVKE